MTPIRIAYAKVAPGAAQAMYAANSYFDGCSIPQLLRRLVELRVSQINGCSHCIWLHSRQIKELGETGERLTAIEHWRAALCLSDAERAALEWAEFVTRIVQLKGGQQVTLTPGQTFYEGPEDVHVVDRNASGTNPAKFLVFMIKDKGAPAL